MSTFAGAKRDLAELQVGILVSLSAANATKHVMVIDSVAIGLAASRLAQ